MYSSCEAWERSAWVWKNKRLDLWVDRKIDCGMLWDKERCDLKLWRVDRKRAQSEYREEEKFFITSLRGVDHFGERRSGELYDRELLHHCLDHLLIHYVYRNYHMKWSLGERQVWLQTMRELFKGETHISASLDETYQGVAI